MQCFVSFFGTGDVDVTPYSSHKFLLPLVKLLTSNAQLLCPTWWPANGCLAQVGWGEVFLFTSYETLLTIFWQFSQGIAITMPMWLLEPCVRVRCMSSTIHLSKPWSTASLQRYYNWQYTRLTQWIQYMIFYFCS